MAGSRGATLAICSLLLAWPVCGQDQPKVPKDAIKPLATCAGNYDRTFDIHLLNQTSASVEIAFAQGTAKVGPNGYTGNTGVFALCSNQPSGASCSGDPCVIGNDRRPIQADHGELSANLCQNGKCVTVNARPVDAPPGQYFQRMGWTITYGKALLTTNIRELTSIEIVPATELSSR